MPTRRALLIATTLGLSAPGQVLRAESGRKFKRIGMVGVQRDEDVSQDRLWLEFNRQLRQRGWVEGENLIVERLYFYLSDREQLTKKMAELIALDVDVIFAVGVWAALAAKDATDRIPIVFSVGDALGRGVVSSLARPDRNLTGTSLQFVEMQAKRADLLKVVAPGTKRIAALMNTGVGWPPAMFSDSNKPRGVEVLVFPLRNIDDLGSAIAGALAQRVDAVLVGQGLQPQHRASLVGAVARLGLPAMYPDRDYVELGGLLCSAPDWRLRARMNAILVDKVLRGAKPADSPVEQPLGYDLAINLKTAKALGITIPRELLVRADWIVE